MYCLATVMERRQPNENGKCCSPVQIRMMPALWMGISALLALVYPWCLVKVIDDGVSRSDETAIIWWLSGAVISLILSGILRYLARRLIAQQAIDAEKKTLKHLYSRVFSADLREIPDHAQGEFMGQILSCGAAQHAFIEALYDQGIPLLCTAVGTLIALMSLSWSLALASLVLFPIAAVLLVWVRRRIRPATRHHYETQEKLFRDIVEDFRAMVSIRALHQTNRFSQRFSETVDNRAAAAFDLNDKQAIQGPILDILQAVMLGIIFGIGSFCVLHSELTVGVLVGFQIYMARLFVLIRSGVGLFGSYQHYIEGIARAQTIDNLKLIQPQTPEIAQSPELLRIEHMTFGFDTHPVWNDKSLIVSEGQLETILLPSGGGKTTLARCILGLYPLQSGTIAVPDGNPATIGFVPQENVLFDGTLYDNISLMCAHLEDAEYQRILDICIIADLEKRFKNQTIGEQGMKLSGGEQRRVMLARALAGSPKCLIIDQMVSELEPELCRNIFRNIREAYPKLGILYLGHRMPEI